MDLQVLQVSLDLLDLVAKLDLLENQENRDLKAQLDLLVNVVALDLEDLLVQLVNLEV